MLHIIKVWHITAFFDTIVCRNQLIVRSTNAILRENTESCTAVDEK